MQFVHSFVLWRQGSSLLWTPELRIAEPIEIPIWHACSTRQAFYAVEKHLSFTEREGMNLLTASFIDPLKLSATCLQVAVLQLFIPVEFWEKVIHFFIVNLYHSYILLLLCVFYFDNKSVSSSKQHDDCYLKDQYTVMSPSNSSPLVNMRSGILAAWLCL